MASHEKIVVVDDDDRILRSVQLSLGQYYELICFSRGETALDFLRKPNSINLVLLDVFMKDLDGLTVLREIKKINADISVMLITGMGSKDIAIQALRNKADDFLEKPFKVDELREKVKVLLKEKFRVYSDKSSEIERMKYFVHKNYRNVSLKSIADEVYLSPKYTSRLFKNKNKCSFRNYKIKIKMDKAKTLLKNSSYTVCQISNILGYQNPESFMRLFKKIHKLTPTEFRKKKISR